MPGVPRGASRPRREADEPPAAHGARCRCPVAFAGQVSPRVVDPSGPRAGVPALALPGAACQAPPGRTPASGPAQGSWQQSHVYFGLNGQ